MKVLAIIPARGGSKGVPRKNIRLLAGKPLLQYSVESALKARRLTRVLVSTDDAEIAEVAQACGAEVPFLRPEELARDETPTLPVLQDAVRRLEQAGERYDAVLTLQPTHPLRRAEDIDGAIELMERTGADSVIAYVEVGHSHPAIMRYLAPDGRVLGSPLPNIPTLTRRQDLPPIHLREGSIYLTRREVLLEQSSLEGTVCYAWLVPAERACNIDTELDFTIAEILLQRHEP